MKKKLFYYSIFLNVGIERVFVNILNNLTMGISGKKQDIMIRALNEIIKEFL